MSRLKDIKKSLARVTIKDDGGSELIKDVRWAVSEIERLQAITTWHPMSTAPKTGEEVLLCVETRAGMDGKMLVGHFMPGGHCIDDHPPISEGWYFWNGCMFDKAAKPTCWMALPKADAEEALKEKP